MEQLRLFADTYLSTLHIPKMETIQYSDILEILILSILSTGKQAVARQQSP